MDAPDKIYLERSLSFPDKFHNHWYKEDVFGNGEEYIRKDLLLEWLNQQLLVDMPHDLMQGYRYAIHDVVDKINSL